MLAFGSSLAAISVTAHDTTFEEEKIVMLHHPKNRTCGIFINITSAVKNNALIKLQD